MTTKTILKTDKRGRVRFTRYGFRFEILPSDPTNVVVYYRENDGLGGETETKLGVVRLTSAAFRMLNGTAGDGTVIPRIAPPLDDYITSEFN